MEIAFKEPLMFFLLLLVPVLVVLHYYFFEHTKQKAMKFSNFSAMKRVSGTHLITKNNWQLALRLIAFILLIGASSQPTMWTQGEVSINDYVIALDTSASMIASDVQPSRLQVAKQSAKNFVDSLDVQTNVGLMTFSGVSLIKHPVDNDLGLLKQSIDAVDIELSGGTDIGGALVTASNMLLPHDKSKVIILITDGSDTSGSFIDQSIETGLGYVVDKNIRVYTIGIGEGNAPAGYAGDVPLKAEFNENVLTNIALRTQGEYFAADSSTGMAIAFSEINKDKETGQIATNLGGIFFTLAMILLVVEWGLLNTRFRAFP